MFFFVSCKILNMRVSLEKSIVLSIFICVNAFTQEIVNETIDTQVSASSLSQDAQKKIDNLDVQSKEIYYEFKDTVAEYKSLKTYDDQFENISTINEPWCVSWLSHYLGEHAPGIKNIQSAAKTMHNILFAHSQSVEALRSCNDHQIGIVLNNQFGQPIDSNEENIQATKLFDEIHNRWFSDAIFKGKYPELALSILEKYLPENYKTQLELISSPIDWIGLNYYTRSLIKYKKSDDGVNYECNSGTLKKTDMGWEFYPEGLSYFIKRINKEYDNNIPIYITENGMANNDKLSLGNSIKDHDRIEFFNIHLKKVLNCVNEKLPVKGYFAWSLLDNYEWAFGYSKRFGLVFTDFQNFKRIPKNSYYEFQKYLK